MSKLAETIIPEDKISGATDLVPEDADFLAGLGTRLGAPPAAPDDPVVPAREPEPVAPVDPKKPDPAKPDPVKQERPEAAQRIKSKELEAKIAEYEKELTDLREKSGKLPELETSLTEFKTLAEQETAARKKLEEAYRNEAAAFPHELIHDIPEVKAAHEKFRDAGSVLFPEFISDMEDDMDPDVRFDPGALTDPQRASVARYLDQYEEQEFRSKETPAVRAETQRALISAIAKTIGVNPGKFNAENFRGTELDMLPKTHPVYKHLRSSLRPFLEERARYFSAQDVAKGKAQESLSTVIGTRVSNTKAMYKNTGVGLEGEALAEALSNTPDSPVLQAMQVLQGHPDLMEELKTNMEHESSLNGIFRPTLDMVEVDPQERTAKATAANLRIGMRALHAPMAGPLMKALTRANAEIIELKKLKEVAEAEASKTRIQSEAGGGGAGGDELDAEEGGDPYLAGIEEQLKRRNRL